MANYRTGYTEPSQDDRLLDASARAANRELAMIAAMLSPYNARPKLAPVLAESDFVSPLMWKLYRAILQLRHEGILPDVPTLAPYFANDPELIQAGGMKFLERIRNLMPEEATEVDVAAALKGEVAKRRLYEQSQQLGMDALDPMLTAGDVMAKAEAEFAKLRAGDVGVRPRTLRDVAYDLASDLLEAPRFHETGIPILDSAMEGGLHIGRLYAFAARPKVGKTAVLATLASNLAHRGVRCLYVALEMGAKEIAQRMIAGRLGDNAVRFLRRDRPDFAERVSYYAQDKAPDCLFFEDRPGLTFEAMKLMFGEYVIKHRVEVIFLDYWQLVGGRSSRDTEASHMGAVAQWMADFVKSHGLAVVTAAQINREGETRGGDGLKLSCDMYMSMHRAPEFVDRPQEIVMEMENSRYTMSVDIGTDDQPKLYIDRVGPRLRQWGQ